MDSINYRELSPKFVEKITVSKLVNLGIKLVDKLILDIKQILNTQELKRTEQPKELCDKQSDISRLIELYSKERDKIKNEKPSTYIDIVRKIELLTEVDNRLVELMKVEFATQLDDSLISDIIDIVYILSYANKGVNNTLKQMTNQETKLYKDKFNKKNKLNMKLVNVSSKIPIKVVTDSEITTWIKNIDKLGKTCTELTFIPLKQFIENDLIDDWWTYVMSDEKLFNGHKLEPVIVDHIFDFEGNELLLKELQVPSDDMIKKLTDEQIDTLALINSYTYGYNIDIKRFVRGEL